MVISLSFGLAFGRLIVLFLLPAFLTAVESLRQRLANVRGQVSGLMPDAAQILTAGRARRLTRDDPSTEGAKG